MSDTFIDFQIGKQPDLVSCGPTCLHAVYQHFGDTMELQDLAREIPTLQNGGTLGVNLATHARQRGYSVDLYTYNLVMFDPSWFADPDTDWPSKLAAQAKTKTSHRLRSATRHYLKYLELGGRIHMVDLTAKLIRHHLRNGSPILTGVSSTFLYRDVRVVEDTLDSNDVTGMAEGHFVVLCGYRSESREVLVADPYHPNRVSQEPVYAVSIDRLINAILLGILTYDANLVVIRPTKRHA